MPLDPEVLGDVRALYLRALASADKLDGHARDAIRDLCAAVRAIAENEPCVGIGPEERDAATARLPGRAAVADMRRGDPHGDPFAGCELRWRTDLRWRILVRGPWEGVTDTWRALPGDSFDSHDDAIRYLLTGVAAKVDGGKLVRLTSGFYVPEALLGKRDSDRLPMFRIEPDGALESVRAEAARGGSAGPGPHPPPTYTANLGGGGGVANHVPPPRGYLKAALALVHCNHESRGPGPRGTDPAVTWCTDCGSNGSDDKGYWERPDLLKRLDRELALVFGPDATRRDTTP